MSNVNILSYRPIKDGKQYDKLFSSTNCTPSFLGNGTTYFTLNQMEKWAYKYQNQTKKLAKKLQGNSLQQTVNNIYNFCHDHLQYNKDGVEQNLRSPNCTWSERANGIDCKSYSLFVSSLLLNLGIHHYFRKIRQDANNIEFGHVYVVIPTDQHTQSLKKYLVIDPTIHTNLEVPFVEKKDRKMKPEVMPHYGLNGASINFDEEAETLDDKVKGLNDFLKAAINQGLNVEDAYKLRNHVKNQVQIGNDPFFKPVPNGLWVDNNFYPVVQNFNGLASGTEPTGGGGSDSGGGSGNWWTTAIKFVAGLVNWKGMGRFFSEGWRFSCWGSSTGPNHSKKWVQQYVEPYAEQNLTLLGSVNSLTEMSNLLTKIDRDLNVIREQNIYKIDKVTSNCSKDGHEIRKKAVEEILENFRQKIEQSKARYNIQKVAKTITASQHSVPPIPMNWDGKTKTAAYYQYTVTDKNGNSNNGGNGNTNTGSKNYTNAILGTAALAGLFFIPVGNKKKGTTTKKPTVKKTAPRKRTTTRRRKTSTSTSK